MDKSTNQTITGQSINQPTNHSVNGYSKTGQLTNHCPSNQPVTWSIDLWPTNQPVSLSINHCPSNEPDLGSGKKLSCLEHRTFMPLMQVRFPGARDFSPRVNFQWRLSYARLYTPVCNRMHEHLCARKRSHSPCPNSVDYGNTKTPSMHSRLGSTTLSQLAFTRESNPNCPWGKSHWDNTVVKK